MTIKTSIWDCSSPSQRAGSCQANPEFDVGPMAPIFHATKQELAKAEEHI